MAEFVSRLSAICNSSCVAFALSLAKETGITQALLDAQEPLTSQQIADAKRLKERYVREIVNSMVTADLLHATIDDQADVYLYHLEEEEKKALNSALLPYTSFPAVLSSVYDQVKSCIFREGPYSTRYSESAHNMIDEFCIYETDEYVECMLSCVDGLKNKLETGIEAIEFGCGGGRIMGKLASMFPKTTFLATDVVSSLVEKVRSRWGHLPNIQYTVMDLCTLPESPPKQYDWVFCVDVIHDLPYPMEALKGIRRLVKEPDGVFTFFDIATSGDPLEDKGDLEVAAICATSVFLCIPESYQREDSTALGACWGKKTAINMATSAGFNVKTIMINNTEALHLCRPQL